MGAALHLVLGHLDEAVVVVGEQQLLGLARALRVDACPISVGAGSWASGVAVIIEETCGGRGAGRAAGVRPRTRSTMAAMCSVVQPQQPPTMETP